MKSNAVGTYSYKRLYNLLTAVTFLRMGMSPLGIISFQTCPELQFRQWTIVERARAGSTDTHIIAVRRHKTH